MEQGLKAVAGFKDISKPVREPFGYKKIYSRVVFRRHRNRIGENFLRMHGRNGPHSKRNPVLTASTEGLCVML